MTHRLSVTLFSVIFTFFGFVICENIHLPLDDLLDQKLSTQFTGPIGVGFRSNGKALSFDGNKGPVFINYTQHEIKDVTSSCFHSLSHCSNFITTFWLKLKLHSLSGLNKTFIHHGSMDNKNKGLNINLKKENLLQISFDNGDGKRVVDLEIIQKKWNRIKIIFNNSSLSAETNGITKSSESELSKFNNVDLSPESLILGFTEKTNGIIVELDDFKFELPQVLESYQSDLSPQKQNFMLAQSLSQDQEISVSGHNYLKYSFENKVSRVSQNEKLDLVFRFEEDVTSGLIWYAEKGFEKSFIYLKESRLYYVYIYRQSDGGSVITLIEEIYVPQILLPNIDHRLVIERTLDRLTLTINENLKANKPIIVGRVPLLPPEGYIFIGGHNDPNIVTEGKIDNRFRGTIKSVLITGDQHEEINMIQIIKDSQWEKNINNFGEVKIQGSKGYDYDHTGDYLISATPIPFTFTEFDKLVRFSPWDFDQFESIEIQFKTKEPKGVLLFVGPDNAHTDYVCLEFFDQNLYFAFGIDIKDYRVQMNPKGTSVTTGIFHTIFIKRDKNHKYSAKFNNVEVDLGQQSGQQKAFGSYTYIGGIDNPSRLPWYIWSREGFVGCVNYMRVNEDKYIDPRGKNNQYSGDIAGVDIGQCLNDVRQCTASHCQGGVCHDRTFPYLSDKNFFCDCAFSSKTYKNPVGNIERGETCITESEILKSDGSSFYVVDFKSEDSRDKMYKTHTDDIRISFKTTQSDGTIFRTHRSNTDFYFSVILEGGYVVIETNINDKDKTGVKQKFRVPNGGLNDNNWHTIYINRRAEHIMAYVDNVNNQIFGMIPVISYGRTFDNTFEYIFVGSNNFEAGINKFIGSMRNFYWNQFDLLGTPRLSGTYRGSIKTPKPSLPPVPIYPRDPPVKCTMKPGHMFTKVSNILANQEEIGFYIEFKTRYNGVIWHGFDTKGPNERSMTFMIIDNHLILIYRMNEDRDLYIVEDGSQFQISDNRWHRITVLLNKKFRRITVYVDNSDQPKIINLAVNERIEITKMDFYFGGMPDSMYNDVFTQLRVRLARLAEKVALVTGWSLVGCLGEFLVSEDKFTSNRLSGASETYPLNSLDCSGCKEPMKCEENFCKNRGICFQATINSLGCNCTSTGFIGDRCEKIEPRCPINFCGNGGRCFMYGEEPRCDCSGTGYQGNRCEQSHCTDSSCLNNGICRIVNGSPTCDCQSTQHYGRFCEKPICSGSVCNNRGRCYVANDKPTCDCSLTGFMGPNCEKEICPLNFCKNDGRCIPRNNQPTCECVSGFTGSQCTERICSVDYCYNGGECYTSNNLPMCRCHNDFEGSRCQIRKACPQDYCFYGGICEIRNGHPYCNCQNSDYEGDRCNIPKRCPQGYCQNNGNCKVKNGRYECQCLDGFKGDQCQDRKECPQNFCSNNGVCSVVNNQFQCDCSRTGYSGQDCTKQVIGIVNEYDKKGYVSFAVQPSIGNDTISVGFQTFIHIGTIFTFITEDGRYWSLKIENGKLVVDINGKIFGTQTVVNDGQYYVVNIDRQKSVIFIRLSGSKNEYLTLPFNVNDGQYKDIVTTKVIVGGNHQGKDIFIGAIGGFTWNGRYILKDIKEDERIGEVTIVLVPTIINKPVSCPNNFCHNNGICLMIDLLPYCQCEHTGYFGLRCERKTYGIFPDAYTTGGYLIFNFIPSQETHKDEMKFLLQTHNHPDNPIVRFELEGGQFYEIKMIQGQLFLVDNRNILRLVSGGQRMDSGNPYFVRFERDRENIVFFINGRRTASLKMTAITGSSDSLIYKRIIFGADSTFKHFFQGALGGFEWNGQKMIDDHGKLLPNVDIHGQVTIILMPTFNLTVTPPKKIKNPLPDLLPTGIHGGAVWKGPALFIPGVGSGGGAIIPAGVGPIVMGAGSYLGLVVSPLVGGLLLAGLLLLSGLIWACWRCKPGCCPCCAGLSNGKSSGMGVGHRIFTPMQMAGMSTARGQTGEKSFWSRFKSNFGTPISHDIYQSGGFKSENMALLSSQANGIGYGDQGDFHSTTIKEERLQINRNFDESIHSLPAVGPSFYTSTNQIRSTRSTAGGAAGGTGHNYGHGNILDMNDRFGTIGQGSIMRIDTMQQETDFDVRPNAFAGEEMKVDCCVLSQNSKYAVTGSAISPPQIWDMQSGELFKVMDGMEIGCTDLHLACGDQILVGLVVDDISPDIVDHYRLKRLQMWDFMTGSQITMPFDVMCSASCITNSSDHLIINRETPDGNMSIISWNLQSNYLEQELHYQPPDFMNHEGITFLKISHDDGKVIAGFTGVDDQAHYMVFDLRDSYPNRLTVKPMMVSFNAKTSATEIIGSEEALTGTKKGELVIWNLRTAKPVRQILVNAILDGNTQTTLNPHKDVINCISISKNGEYLVSGSADQTLNIYTMTDEKLMHTLEGHADDVLSAVISLDNEIVVSGSWDGSVRVWNLESGSQMCWFTSNIEILSVKLTNDKKAIVALGERMGLRKLIMLQIIRNRTRRTRHTGNAIGSSPFSPMSV